MRYFFPLLIFLAIPWLGFPAVGAARVKPAGAAEPLVAKGGLFAPRLAVATGEANVPSAVKFPAEDYPGLEDRWLRASTEAFEVISNAKSRRVVAALENLEAFRAVLKVVLPALVQEPRRKTLVYFFDDRRQFRSYGVDNAYLAGLFFSRPEANYIVVDASQADPYATVLHEYMHYLLRNNAPNLPLWLNEGLAEYFEGFSTERGRGRFGHHEQWSALLATPGWLDFDRILETTASSELYRDPATSRWFRAQSWALVHYLYDPKNRSEQVRFLESLGPGNSRQALTKALEVNLEGLEELIRIHVRKLTSGTQVLPLRSLEISSISRPEQMSRALVLERLGQLLATEPSEPRSLRANALFEEAQRLSGQRAEPMVLQASLWLSRAERLDEASDLIERALALDSSNSHAYYLRGNLCLALLNQPESGGFAPEELLAMARTSYERAIHLDPHFRIAINQLANTYTFDRRLTAKGIQLTQAALEDGPDLSLAVTLMELHARAGDREAAQRVYQDMIRVWVDASAESSLSWVARAAEHSDLLVARAWLEDGRCEEAAHLLRRAMDQSLFEELRMAFGRDLELWGRCGEPSPSSGSSSAEPDVDPAVGDVR